jgi:threonine dehydrogenase-like Zn-dependent dehydrogenase
VKEPKIQDDTDVIVRITASAICGTDLHFIRGTMAGVKPGRILGHEAVGVVEEVGKGVRNLRAGDRVVVPSTVGCGYCSYCRAGYFAQCDNASPNGKRGGTVFFGGPEDAGGLDGLQAEYARIPFGNVGLVKLPDHVTDEQAIMISDIFPTAYFGAELAEIDDGDTVCVLGCGPVGQFAIASAKLLGAGRIFAVDCVPDRLIDAVGIDAQHAHHGPAGKKAKQKAGQFEEEVKTIAPDHRKYIPHLVDLVASGAFDPAQVITKTEPMRDAISAYKEFDQRHAGWLKVELTLGGA